jgi:DNA-binding winged helix-turn-helix (wHTH) protein
MATDGLPKHRPVHFAGFTLSWENPGLSREGAPIHLSRKGLLVLRCLVERAGELVRKQELLDAIWPETYIQEENLKGYILEIRRALGDSAKEPAIIETRQGIGYRFMAPFRDTPGQAINNPAVKVFERERQLKILQESWALAQTGSTQFILLRGDTGVGKTTVLEHFLEGTRSSSPVLQAVGCCVKQYDAPEPFFPLLAAFGRALRSPNSELLRFVLTSHAPSWTAHFPWLADATASLGSPASMIRELGETLATICSHTALILAIEDLHWADTHTLTLIAELAHRKRLQLLIIGSDSLDEGQDLNPWIGELEVTHACRVVSVDPLTRSSVGRYIDAFYKGSPPAPELIELVYRCTDGNPMLLTRVVDRMNSGDALSAWDETNLLPDVVRRHVEQRGRKLNSDERWLMVAACFMPGRFSAEELANIPNIDAGFVERICEHLVMKHLLRRVGEREITVDNPTGVYEFSRSVDRIVFSSTGLVRDLPFGGMLAAPEAYMQQVPTHLLRKKLDLVAPGSKLVRRAALATG